MATKVVEGQLPYTGGTAINIDGNKVISVLLREENNLILVNDDNELYTDLQLADGIKPSDDFPVGVTVGKVLASDGWTRNGLLLNRKTTSGDYARWIYASNGEIYFDGGNGTWKQVYYSDEVDALFTQLRGELATVAFSGDYNDLINRPAFLQEQADWEETDTDAPSYIKHKPTIPTVNDATLTVQKNGISLGSFTANSSTNATINVPVPNVINNVTSTSTSDALSANQGKLLQDQIDNLKAMGKFLSLWDCATGLPISFPLDIPYNYSTGDYFLVENVSTTTNYRPSGVQYTGTASTTVETDEVEIGDLYIYDGQVWLLQINHGKSVSFANLSGQPSDNANLAAALNAKQNLLTAGKNIDLTNNIANLKLIEVEVTTAYNTAAKIGTTTAGNYTPTKGDLLLVNFVNGSVVNSPNLNIDGSGAKLILTGFASANVNSMALGTTPNSNVKIIMYYDGDAYKTWSTTNTVYGLISETEIDAGTSSTARSISAERLQYAIDSKNTVKVFSLYNTTDLVTAQAAYDWQQSGKVAILSGTFGNYIPTRQYFYATADANDGEWISNVNFTIDAGNGAWTSSQASNSVRAATIEINPRIKFTVSSGTVTAVTYTDVDSTYQDTYDAGVVVGHPYLATDLDYPVVYNPLYDGSPATKKYVDDAIAGAGVGDMLYSDFDWETKTGASITLDFNSEITPSANFTVNAPSTIKDGQTYILRVTNGATAYTMTLGTNITNPYNTDITLTANGVDQFVFLAIGGNLELQPDAEGGSGITKIFTLSSTSDLTTAQEAYDWYANGGNPILKYNYSSTYYAYFHLTVDAGSLYFGDINVAGDTVPGSLWNGRSIRLTVSSGSVTAITYTENSIAVSSSAPTSAAAGKITLVI